MVVVRIYPKGEDLIDFKGDALICPCDVEITRNTLFTKRVFREGGPELLRECSAIGFCEVGNAIITKGYGLPVKHIIFLPVDDRGNKNRTANYLTLHQGLRNALTLASAYSVKTLATPAILLRPSKTKAPIKRLIEMFTGSEGVKEPTELQKEFINILTTVSSEFNGAPRLKPWYQDNARWGEHPAPEDQFIHG